jgi:peptidoglycan-associated lipoprotein
VEAFRFRKILDVMNQYPKMKLDIRSHTDSRGSSNITSLYQTRAQSIGWLIENGVDKTRLTADMGNPNL